MMLSSWILGLFAFSCKVIEISSTSTRGGRAKNYTEHIYLTVLKSYMLIQSWYYNLLTKKTMLINFDL
jgi:hypothetical protein